MSLTRNGHEAIEKVNQMAFDLVFIDIKLPDINGITLLKEIKKISPESSCIIITGYGTLQNAVKALTDGADAYFLKPLLIEEVSKRVEELLEKQRMQQELKKSEKKYRHLFERSPYMIVLINSNGKIIDVNQSLLDYTGYKREQLISLDFKNFKYISPENLPILIKNFKVLLSKGKIEPFEVQINFDDDRIAWLNIQGSLVILEEGSLIQVIIQDISEKKKARQELIESEKRYRSLFEHMNAGFAYLKIIVDENKKPIDCEFLELNPAFEELTGLKADEIKNKSVTEVLPGIENDPADWIGKLGKVALTGIPLTFESYLEPLGQWYNVSAYSPKEGYFAITFSNITARKKAEQTINESEEKYRKLIKSSPTSIVLLDSKGRIIDCNKTTEDLITLSKNGLIGKNFLDLFILNNRSQWAYDTFRKILKGELEEPIFFEFTNKEGKKYSLICSISLFQMSNKRFIQVVSQDITAQMHAEKLIKQELENLKELDQIKNDLLQRISHELRTPLTSIYSSSQFLLNYCKDDMVPRIKKFINIINTGGYRLKELVDNLFLAYDIESDKLKLRLQNSDIIPPIEESIKEVAQIASKRKISIHKKLHDDLFLTFDVPKIRKVITNLLFNAVQNTFKNGSIQIITKRDINNVDIIIKDTGIGFIEKEKQMLFKKFGKIERYGKGMDIYTEGPGLGLYISKEFIELHGGKIWVETEGRNKGSTFIIRLPVKK